jgi:hypothetical protein
MYRHGVVQYNVPAHCCTVQFTGMVFYSTMCRHGVLQYHLPARCCTVQCTGTLLHSTIYRHGVVQYNVPEHRCTVQYTGTFLYNTMYRHGFVQYNVPSGRCTLQCTGRVLYSTKYLHGIVQTGTDSVLHVLTNFCRFYWCQVIAFVINMYNGVHGKSSSAGNSSIMFSYQPYPLSPRPSDNQSINCSILFGNKISKHLILHSPLARRKTRRENSTPSRSTHK